MYKCHREMYSKHIKNIKRRTTQLWSIFIIPDTILILMVTQLNLNMRLDIASLLMMKLIWQQVIIFQVSFTRVSLDRKIP